MSAASKAAQNTATVYSFNFATEFEATKIYKNSHQDYYTRAFSEQIVEVPLKIFKKWYSPLRLAKYVDEVIVDDALERWVYRVIFVNPSQKLDPSKKQMYDWATTILAKSYLSTFNQNDEDEESIMTATTTDKSIMLVAMKLSFGSKIPKIASKAKCPVVVVAAVTYRHGLLVDATTTPETIKPDLSKVIITWFHTAGPSCEIRPTYMQSWRRHGFGTFMLIHVIKRNICDQLTLNKETRTDKGEVDVYLQSTQAAAFHFYTACGFRWMNDDSKEKDDGFKLLPASLQAAIAGAHALTKKSPFIHLDPKVSDAVPAKLLLLWTGNLQLVTGGEEANTIDPVSEDEVSHYRYDSFGNKNLKWWCMYPIRAITGGPSLTCQVMSSDIEKTLEGLTHLQQLLPSFKPPLPLLPPGAIGLNGEMRAERREAHAQVSGGKVPKPGQRWMNSWELEMMFAFLMRDGRYQEYCTIIPFSYLINLAEGAHHHSRYKQALSITTAKGTMSESNRMGLQTLANTSSNQMNDVIKKLLENRRILDKRLIVFQSMLARRIGQLCLCLMLAILQRQWTQRAMTGIPAFFDTIRTMPSEDIRLPLTQVLFGF